MRVYPKVSGLADCLEQELQMVQLSATRCSCIAILWVSLVGFAAITLFVASQQVLLTQSGKLDTSSYCFSSRDRHSNIHTDSIKEPLKLMNIQNTPIYLPTNSTEHNLS
jgi:hypothetical protein